MWEKYKPHICMYLKKGLKDEFDQIPLSNENVIIKSLLEYYRKYFYKKNQEFTYILNNTCKYLLFVA